LSFILDALKKSESDRQREVGPALFEVKVAPPRRGLPAWAIVVGALLLVNAVVLAGLLWRGRTPAEAAATSVSTVPPATVPTTTSPVPEPPATSAPAISPPTATVPPIAPPRRMQDLADPPSPALDPALDADELPALEPEFARSAPPGASSGVTRGSGSDVPTLDDLPTNVANQIPEYRLDLHAHAASAAERFVFINMRRLREGDALDDGTRVEAITAEGAVLVHRGTRFLLPRP
jgi:general secretion pathway protein B